MLANTTETEPEKFGPLPKFSFLQKLVLRSHGSVFVRYAKLKGWKASLPVYAINCPCHGIVLTYPTGFDRVLRCEKCLDEEVQKTKNVLYKSFTEKAV